MKVKNGKWKHSKTSSKSGCCVLLDVCVQGECGSLATAPMHEALLDRCPNKGKLSMNVEQIVKRPFLEGIEVEKKKGEG